MISPSLDSSGLLAATLLLVAGATASGPGRSWGVATRECPLHIPAALQPHGKYGCPAPIDESVEGRPAMWSPWSHAPACVIAAEDNKTKFCVYTNSRHGHHGFSLITTPEHAAGNVRVLDEPTGAGIKTPKVADQASDRPFKVVDVPGKGKGVVATRLIRRYEKFMTDYASLVIDMRFPTAVQRLKGYELLHLAARQLPDPDRVLALGRSSNAAQDVVEDVLRTNAFHTPLGDEHFMALYPDVARMNHACKPNAFTQFLPDSLLVNAAASKDIQPGEEITISYITVGKTLEQRQGALKRWGFNCTCSLCTAPEEERAASDARRAKIGALQDEVLEAFQDGNAPKSIRLTQEILDIARTEDLFQLYADQYENLARVYWAIKDKQTATKYAKKSLGILEEQGYVKARPEHIEMLLRTFDE